MILASDNTVDYTILPQDYDLPHNKVILSLIQVWVKNFHAC